MSIRVAYAPLILMKGSVTAPIQKKRNQRSAMVNEHLCSGQAFKESVQYEVIHHDR